MYRSDTMLTHAYVSSRLDPELYSRMQFWHDWEDRWKEGKCWIENAQVEEPGKDYWLAIWILNRARVDLASLWNEPGTGPADHKRSLQRFEEAIHLAKGAIFRRRRAIEQGTGKAADGYETLAQGLADQASGYDAVIRDCWRVLEKLREDPRGVVIRMTVEFEREIRALWERARRVLRPKETLARFYARCARTAAYAASIHAFRDNPTRPLHEVEEAAEKAFKKWLRPYPFEAARDTTFKAETRLAEVLERIQRLEDVLRNEARRWTGE